MDYRGAMEKPFFTLSIRARGGTPLELSQDTPPGMFANGVMHLDQTLVLSTPIAEIPQGESSFLITSASGVLYLRQYPGAVSSCCTDAIW